LRKSQRQLRKIELVRRAGMLLFEGQPCKNILAFKYEPFSEWRQSGISAQSRTGCSIQLYGCQPLIDEVDDGIAFYLTGIGSREIEYFNAYSIRY
jgi:hypothetical protein